MARATCPQCQRPQRTCQCDLRVPTSNAIEVVIWQHPKEVQHPKNSALLLQQSLENCHTLVAETLSEQEFKNWCKSHGSGETKKPTCCYRLCQKRFPAPTSSRQILFA